jgi:hypothetical protein
MLNDKGKMVKQRNKEKITTTLEDLEAVSKSRRQTASSLQMIND